MASLLDPQRPAQKSGESRDAYRARTKFDPGLQAPATDFTKALKPRLGAMMEPRLGPVMESSATRNRGIAGHSSLLQSVAGNPAAPLMSLLAGMEAPPIVPPQNTKSVAQRWTRPGMAQGPMPGGGIFRAVTNLPKGQFAQATFEPPMRGPRYAY